MKKIETLLKGLLDREEIRDLPARYCDCVWRNDIPGLVRLFAPDGVFSMVTPQQSYIARGHTELMDFYVRGLAITPRPFIHNQVVELGKKGHASGRCYLELRSARRDMAWIGAGYYLDQYVKHKGAWKFASREFTALRMEDEPAQELVEAPEPAAAPVKRAPRRPRKATPAKS